MGILGILGLTDGEEVGVLCRGIVRVVHVDLHFHVVSCALYLCVTDDLGDLVEGCGLNCECRW
jgi:hypothetical protein